jgi:hypothetical protein
MGSTSTVFLVARGFQDDVVLDGTVYIDETFYSVVEGKKVRDGTGKEPRGLSRNKYCIGTMSDAKGRIYLKSEGRRGKPSCASTLDCYLGHIGAGSTVVHDGEKSHRRLIRELDLREQVFPSKETRGLADHDNPMDRINSVHRLLKRFLNVHGGFYRDDLQDYLNLFAFITNTPQDMNMKIEEFLKRSLETSILLRYRDEKPN